MQKNQQSNESTSILSSYSSLHPIFTPNTAKQTRKTIKYFTIVAIMNATMSLGWLSFVIWIGVGMSMKNTQILIYSKEMKKYLN